MGLRWHYFWGWGWGGCGGLLLLLGFWLFGWGAWLLGGLLFAGIRCGAVGGGGMPDVLLCRLAISHSVGSRT